MRLALILSDLTERVRGLQRNLAGDFSVIVGRSVAEGLDLLQTLPVDLVLVDLDSEGALNEELPERIREYRPACALVAVLPARGGGEGAGLSYDAALRADSNAYEINAALARVMERQRLLEEIEHQRAEIRKLQARSERLQAERAPAQPVDKLLKAFSRALSSGFDLERLLNLFADTVLEMMRVSKVSVLLQDGAPGTYRVRCHRGLRPDVVEGLCLRADSGLTAWLAREGRIMTRPLADTSGISPEVRKEMDVLQAVVSLPMMCSGSLVGVLNLNSRVTGSPFLDDELETLFTLSSHMAVAVQEMGVLNRMQHQKSYVEQIVAQMDHGVITINAAEQVVTYNQRAAEILGRPPAEILQRDLRRLPSPLGDILYETMRTGRRYQHDEITILSERIPLEVSSYRLQAPDGEILGSVAVLADLRPRRERERQKRLTDRMDVLHRLLGRLACEIKEPLAHIEQISEELPVGGDSESGPGARESLRREVRQLGALGRKLSAFAGGLEYRFGPQSLNDLVARSLRLARDEGIPESAPVTASIGDEPHLRVRADLDHLPRALAYLLRHAAEQAEPGAPIRLTVHHCHGNGTPGSAEIRLQYPCRAATAAVDCLLDPLAVRETNTVEAVDLGVSVSRRVIEDHGGALAACLNPDGEVCVTVRLPGASAQSDAETLDNRPLRAV